MATQKLMLDYIYEHETNRANQIFLTQPFGGGKVVDYTWGQTMDQARRIAAYLKAQNYEPGSRIAILSKNTAHFMMLEIAIWMAGYTTVAIFPTERAETISYVLDHSEAKMIFVGKLDTWAEQKDGLPAHLPKVEMPLGPKTGFETWDAICARTQPLAGKPGRNGDDLMFIMYTSGSTGTPKGVMHSFARGTAASEAMNAHLERELGAGFTYRALSYLPLAHIFERAWISSANLVMGRGHIFFAESLETFVQDVQRARPTMFISVPRLWVKFQQGVLGKMPQKKLNTLLSIPILSGIVKKKILTGLGLDQVLMAGSGSAPIPPTVIDWYRRLGLKLVEGLGMTEDFAYSHNTKVKDGMPGYVGHALAGVERRIADNGEVLIKSPGTMVGYYKQPELTAESFTPDGFFKTGDKGELSADGQLKLTGRTKEMFKTAKGKYVAPAPIESMIGESPLVELAMVSGSGQASAYALVVPAETIRPKLNDPQVRAEFETEMRTILQRVNSKTADYEQLAKLVIVQQPWTVENGMLTPTMKIKRNKIESNVSANVDKWYGTKGDVIWA